MKRALLVILMVAALIGVSGCDDYDDQPLTFVNSSYYTVVVTSLSIEWTGFVLAPGQHREMTDIRDVDYTFEPSYQVMEGFASTDRYIVFVNRDENE